VSKKAKAYRQSVMREQPALFPAKERHAEAARDEKRAAKAAKPPKDPGKDRK
jgi:hypothetical protein